MRSLKALAAVAALGAAVPAVAGTTTINGGGFSIPLEGSAGSNSSTATSTLSGNVTGLTLTMNDLSHSWIGDLRFTLSKGAKSFDFINFQIPDISGSSNDLNGTYTISDAATTSFQAAANASSPLASGTYKGDATFASMFGGVSSLGDWTLTINDDQTSDTGNLGSWSLAITTASGMGGVPEPATWALMILGFGAVGGAMRRRSAGSLATA